jgi:hypothetical protein
MVRGLLSPRALRQIGRVRAAGYQTVNDLSKDAYQLRRMTRPVGWDTGTQGEFTGIVETGVGFLKVSGQGAPSLGENVISVVAPYLFYLPAASVVATNDELIVNGRSFDVTGVTTGDEADELKVASLEEHRP